MVTSKPYKKMMDSNDKNVKRRMKKYSSEDERLELQDMALEYHSQITYLLDTIDRDLLLIMKINEYLYNIDFSMGSPINTYENTVNIIFR